MLNATQLASIEAAMEEEHQKDREALSRLKRFLPNGNAPKSGRNNNQETLQLSSEVRMLPLTQQPEEEETNTIIGTVEATFQSDPERKWTVPAMVMFLQQRGFPLDAQKPERTMGLVFRKLLKRGKVRLTRRGSGRIPHQYKAVPEPPAERNLLAELTK